MKKIKNIGLILIGLAVMSSCNDSFMDRYPETNITEQVFFSSPEDLKTYTNGMYGYLDADYSDTPSDNNLYIEDTDIYKMMRGEIRPNNVGSWSWSNIRTVNFMLARVGQVKGDQTEINHYVGLARMFRAILYYSKVKDYSDVPWYSCDLQTTDIDLLYKPQDPRTLVVDSIMADLDYAVHNMKDSYSTTVIYRNVALAIQARIALHEGTFRKYHPELNLDDGDRFLEIAVEACQKIIQSGTYSLSEKTVNDLPPYQSLFCSTELTQNPEMILVGDYDKALGRMHNAQAQFDYNTGLSRDLMEDYLVVENGQTKPFHEITGYEIKTYNEVFNNRDPRMEQTFMKPGTQEVGIAEAHRPSLNLGGYPQIKFRPLTIDQMEWGKSYTDLPIIRYAEILLMYAEAKAELGGVTQEDINASINQLRRRPLDATAQAKGLKNTADMVLADITENFDPARDKDVTPLIWEIRRERRMELFYEHCRLHDIKRWKKLEYMDNNKYPDTMIGPWVDMVKEVPAYLDEQYIGKRQVKKEDGTVITFDGSNASEMVGYYMPTNVQPRNTFSDRSYCSPVGEQEINAYAEKGFKLTQTTGW